MKIALFEFQKQALHDLRVRLTAARPMASLNSPQAITLSAPTGSGKTVIMTALFEALLVGPDDQLEWPSDWRPQPDATILWVSDMPELNEQTRRKIEAQSDKVFRVNQLVTIDANFDAERLEGGRVYFINTQKLATEKLLTREGDNRTWSVWRTFANTARAMPDRFYVVVDEAHRGMANGRGTTQAQSIVQRFIKGHPDSGMIRMLLVIGVSATPQRFNDLLADTPHTVHKVQVPAEEVRASGLLKERILIHHPDAPTRAELGLLEEAARRWKVMTDLWADYCSAEGARVVRPILVVQVEDASGTHPTRTDFAAAIRAIEDATGRPLRDAELAHALQDAGEIKVGERIIRRLEASRIEEDPDVSVVFFKMALSTGWDCPRAEVMMSFRRAQDHTYIAQLLGRMVRTPLARRVERRAELNDVHLFLPHFDNQAVKQVIKALQNSEEVPPAEAADARELAVLTRRSGTEGIFEAMQRLVTYRVGAHRAQSNIRRYQAIARKLTIDGVDQEAWDQAKADAVGWIREQVETLTASGELERERQALTQVALRTQALHNITGFAEEREGYVVEASDIDIEHQFEEADRALGNGLGWVYRKAHSQRDATEVKLELIIVSRSQSALANLEKRSGAAFNELYDRHRAAFGQLNEQNRAAYERLRAASATPEPVAWRLPDSIEWRRDPTAIAWDRHLYVEQDGSCRAELGTWEADVLTNELARPETVGWLRNIDRKPWSLEIPHEQAGKAAPMFPDFLIVRQIKNNLLFDVLEPHDPSRADNVGKAKGLAAFAEKHGHLFGRVQLIRGGGGGYRRLDMNRSDVQDRLRLINNNAQLDALFVEMAEALILSRSPVRSAAPT